MPSTITQLIQTQYDGSGVSSFTDGIKQVESETSTAADTADKMGINYEALSRRMERPLGRVAFQGLAADILSANGAIGKAGGATGALAGGLRALGNAAIFAGGEFAMIAIGAVAVYEIYEKIFGASEKAKQSHADVAKSSADEAVAYQDVAKQLKDLDPKYASVAARLNEHAKGSKEAALAILDQAIKEEGAATSQAKLATEIKKTTQAEIELQQQSGKLKVSSEQYEMSQLAQVGNTIALASATTNLTDKQKNLVEIQQKVKALTDQDTKKAHVDTAEEKQVNDIIEKRNIDLMSEVTLWTSLASKRSQMEALEKKYVSETSPLAKKDTAEKILLIKNETTAEEEAIKKKQEITTKTEETYKKRAAITEKYMGTMTDCITTHGKKIVFEGKKFLGEELKDAANQAASYLVIQAWKYFGAGDYAMGALALAAAAAVKAAGTAGAALLESDAGGDAGSTTPSDTSGSGEGSVSSNTDDSKQSKLTLNISGAVGWNNDVVHQLCKELSNIVQTQGATLVSSDLKLSSGIIPT